MGFVRFLVAVAALGPLAGGCSRCCHPPATPSLARVDVIDGFHNPEDIELVASVGLAIVSNTALEGGGSIAGLPSSAPTSPATRLWPHSTTDDFDPADFDPSSDVGDPGCRAELPAECRPALAAAFSPHGISAVELAGGVRVVAVDHRPAGSAGGACAAAFDGRDAIEMFDLRDDGSDHRLVWQGCIRMPRSTRGNDLAISADGNTVVVANCAPHWWSWPAGLLWGAGDVRRWKHRADVDGPWDIVEMPHRAAHNPNGVALTPDALYVSASTTGEVWRLPLIDGEVAGEPKSICVGGYPDNLGVTPRGTLLVSTHTELRKFLRCGTSGCASPWAVYELAPDLSNAWPLVAGDGEDVTLVSSAIRLPESGDERFLFGSVAGHTIGSFSKRASIRR